MKTTTVSYFVQYKSMFNQSKDWKYCAHEYLTEQDARVCLDGIRAVNPNVRLIKRETIETVLVKDLVCEKLNSAAILLQ